MEVEQPIPRKPRKRRSILIAVLLAPVCCWALAFFLGPSLRATAPASVVPEGAELITTYNAAASKRVWRTDEYVVTGLSPDTITAFYRSRAFSCHPTAIRDPDSYSVDAYTNPIHDMGGDLSAVSCERRIRLARDYRIVFYDEIFETVRIFSEVNVYPWD